MWLQGVVIPELPAWPTPPAGLPSPRSKGYKTTMLETAAGRLILLFVCSSLFVICDTLAANWGKNNSTTSLIAVVILAPLSYISFGYVNQKYPLAVASAWVMLALCISTVLIGLFYFGDQLTTAQTIGVVFALIAGALLVL